MGHTLVVARRKNQIISALYEERKLLQLIADPEESQSLAMGTIFIGRVSNIVANINAAFVESQDGTMCYLSLEMKGKPITRMQHADGKIHAGDELVVQVEREAIKTKLPSVTANINLAGKYAVLVHGKPITGVSGKIKSTKRREQLKAIFTNSETADYGFIIRTNAEQASDEELLAEKERLTARYQRLCIQGTCLSRFSVLEKPLASYLCSIRDDYAGLLDQITTDDLMLYEEIREYLDNHQQEDSNKLFLYQRELPMLSLYSFESRLAEALSKKVWLKSGASLIIEPTEALTVIDVNTGKAIKGKRGMAEHFLSVNLEAAREIAAQIRLRNLSGIILIDFIDMDSNEACDILLSELRELLSCDPVKTTLIDMTPLQLVEITRKKVRKPLHEQFL